MSTDHEPQWLDDEEMAAWLPLMGMMVVLPAQLDARMQELAGLTQFEYLVLARLSETEDHAMRISDLAEQWHGSLSRLSHLFKRLERRGWVDRRPDPDDGRYTNVILTDEGWEKIITAAPQQVELVRRLIFDHLSRAQVRQVHAVAERILIANVPGSQLQQALRGAGRGRGRPRATAGEQTAAHGADGAASG